MLENVAKDSSNTERRVDADRTDTGKTNERTAAATADTAGLIIIARMARHRPAALVGWLSLAQLISWGSVFYLFALLLEPIEQALGLTRAQASLAFSLALLAEGLLAWPVGRLIDRGHERAVMAGGSLLLALGLLLHSGVESATGFYAAWLLLGAGMAATLYPPAFAVVIRRYPQDFRRAIIVITFLGGLASTVFIPLSAWLISALGWRLALWPLAGLHLFVCAPIHAWVLRDAPPRPAAAAQAAAAPSLRQHLLGAPFLLVGLFIVLFMGVTAALPPHLVSLLRGAGLAERWVIAAPAAIGVLQVLGRLLLYALEHRWDRHRVNRLVPALIPLSLLALLLALAGAASGLLVLLFVALYGVGNGLLTIVKGTAVAEYVSREQAASLNGALGLPMALARAAAPWLLGLLWTPTAGYQAGLWLLLGACLLGLLALTVAQRLAAHTTAGTGSAS
jgi:MFS family permease